MNLFRHGLHAVPECFNPFFIRASVYCRRGPRVAFARGHSFNPFFIRASVYCPPLDRRAGIGHPVSIPSSSGHQFTASTRAMVMNSTSMFQSLLHQGISLLRRGPRPAGPRQRSVSIPSSSGHQFTGFRSLAHAGFRGKEFQSLLHQGISLLVIDAERLSRPRKTKFQSLLHQGISLLRILCLW